MIDKTANNALKAFTATLLSIVVLAIGVSPITAKTVPHTREASSPLEVNLDTIYRKAIDSLVINSMHKSQISSVSIVIANKEQSRYLSYGYADEEKKKQTSPNTYYELGSMSKAFTALGILLLDEQGKLSLNDPVRKYLPWLKVRYRGAYEGKRVDKVVDLTIKNLLYHTSGIPFKTIGYIPEGTSNDMLDRTIRQLAGTQLDYYPGERFQYATINYDALGLIIEKVTGKTYEQYIQEQVLTPLGLNHTYLFRDHAIKTGLMAAGYKIAFFKARPYDAPRFRGNTPAGFVISNARDMERWIRIQMGLVDVPERFKRIITKSHEGDTTVASQRDYFYGGGWFVHIKGNRIQHGGNNPNFSSMLIMKPGSKIGICVLTNLNSNSAEYLAANILNIVEKKDIAGHVTDEYRGLDKLFSIAAISSVLLGGFFFILLVIALIELIQRKRKRLELKEADASGSLLAIPLMLFLGFCIYYLPNVLLQRLPWKSINIWGSPLIMIGSVIGFIASVIIMLYIQLTFRYPRENEKNYFVLIPLSLANGIASALIIFTINESFNRNLEYSKELLVYFIFSLLLFIYSIKLLQSRLIIITNEIAYEKRMSMINRIMCTSYQSIESIGRERIFSGLNNDCAAVAQVPGIIVGLASSILTLLFCLSYLLMKNVYAFIVSSGVILLNGVISFITSRFAVKYWEKNRDIQDTYFGQIQDLVNGFKELVLNKARQFAFWSDMKKYSRLSTELNKKASINIMNFNLYNALMYNLIFGVVVFLFPLLMVDIDSNQLRGNLFIVFYMIGPFNALAGAIPQLMQLRINMRRINRLIADLDKVSTGQKILAPEETPVYSDPVTIQLKDIVFRYMGEKDNGNPEPSEFVLGPVSMEFRSGEMTFIAGGNGSGKSTLGKLVAGLYAPQSGEILINGKSAELRDLNELFASVYSDFNLFKKLYGIDYQQNKDQIMRYLEMMKIQDKVELTEDGEFKSLNLSTGHRKRLAFVVSCLEDKPMMILDEWAAEQAPQFRHYFYEDLLPMLQAQKKGIIVVTHDDRYFDRADRLIKLERGEVIEEIETRKSASIRAV